jgi:hypothetical protein
MRMNHLPYTALIALATSTTACGDDSASTTDVQPLARMVAGAVASEPVKKVWSGIQSCSGQDRTDEGLKALDKTSSETTIATFSKSTTHVTITGVTVGPTAEYSCSKLSLEGVVTDAQDVSNLYFGSASDDADRQSPCTSATGKPLIVGWLDGYDSDLSSIGGPRKLHFSVLTEQPFDKTGDAGLPFSDLRIKCNFDLELK